MTEQEWLTCNDPAAMLEFLRRRLKQQPGCVSDRKVRLYLVACGRRIWHLLDHESSRRAIEVAELLADGQATDEERLRAYHDADAGFSESVTNPAYFAKHCLNRKVLRRQEVQDGYNAAVAAGWHLLGGVYSDANRRKLEKALIPERQAQSDLVREIILNPFRLIPLDPAWRSWHDATIVRLAQAAYDERQLPAGTLDLERLAVLADALEEAGCTDADILGHLRGPGPHVRGCWVVDALLGRE
jgi:hypothetical protein